MRIAQENFLHFKQFTLIAIHAFIFIYWILNNWFWWLKRSRHFFNGNLFAEEATILKLFIMC